MKFKSLMRVAFTKYIILYIFLYIFEDYSPQKFPNMRKKSVFTFVEQL